MCVCDASVPYKGGSKGEPEGRKGVRPPVKILPPPVSPNEVYDRAFTTC